MPAYAHNTARAAEIGKHLLDCGGPFLDAITARMSVDEYAMKIASRADRFEAWDGRRLIGLVAVYCDDPKSAFITNVSVDSRWRRRGISAELMQHCIAHVASLKRAGINLEVSMNNAAATALYERFGFTVSSRNGSSLVMTKAMGESR